MTLLKEARKTLLTSVEDKAAASVPRQTPQTLLFNNWDCPQDKRREFVLCPVSCPEFILQANTLTPAVCNRYY